MNRDTTSPTRPAGHGSDPEPAAIGQRLKWWRLERKLSQKVLADRAGLTQAYISQIENGKAALDRRTTVEALAKALEISYADLTGQPYRPETPAMHQAFAAFAAVRAAFVGSSLEYGAPVNPRPLEALAADVQAAVDALQVCDYAAASRTLAGTIAELHQAAAHGPDQPQAIALLIRALDTSAWVARILGYPDLACWIASREHDAARTLDQPELIGLAVFTRSLIVSASEGRDLARVMAEDAIDQLRPRLTTNDGLQVLGMLHLAATHAVLPGDPAAYLAEADTLADTTGDGKAYSLWFGPTNVALWKMKVAVEHSDPGQVQELARSVQLGTIPSPARRVMYWRDLGVGLAQERGRQAEAVTALMRAERTAPGKLALDPLVRETVEHMLNTARAAAGGTDLTRLARRLAVLA